MWFLGVLLGIGSCVFVTVGMNLQKISHRRNEMSSSPYCMEPLWLLGMMLILSDSLLDMISFSMAPQSLLAPLGALSMVTNILISPLMLRERPTREEIISTSIITFGIVVSVSSGEHENPLLSMEAIRNLWMESFSVLWIIIVGLSAALSRLTVYYLYDNDTESDDEQSPITESSYEPALYAWSCGSVGSITVLFAKLCTEMVRSATLSHDHPFEEPLSYCFIGALVGCAVLQITILNQGLQRFRMLTFVPLYQVVWALQSIIMGGVFFQEFSNLKSHQLVLFPTGVIITMVGVLTMLRGSADESDEDSPSIESRVFIQRKVARRASTGGMVIPPTSAVQRMLGVRSRRRASFIDPSITLERLLLESRKQRPRSASLPNVSPESLGTFV